MNEIYPDDESLMRFLDEEMEAGEKAAFQQKLSEDPQLQHRLDGLLLSKNALLQYGSLEKVGSIHRSFMEQKKGTSKIVSFRKTAKIVMAIAASLIIFFVINFMYRENGPDADSLYNQAFVSYTVAPERGVTTLSPIEKMYAEGRYADVIAGLKNTPVHYSRKDSLLTGLSYLNTNDAASAIAWLTPLRGQRLYGQDASFYLSMALLKKGEYPQAATIMHSIHRDKNNVYHERFTEKYIKKVEGLQ